MKRCKNCGAILERKDKYCRECGTKKGEKRYSPTSYSISTLYGPPYSAKYCCPNCGKEFTINGLGSAQSMFCPNCGTECNPQSSFNPEKIQRIEFDKKMLEEIIQSVEEEQRSN